MYTLPLRRSVHCLLRRSVHSSTEEECTLSTEEECTLRSVHCLLRRSVHSSTEEECTLSTERSSVFPAKSSPTPIHKQFLVGGSRGELATEQSEVFTAI